MTQFLNVVNLNVSQPLNQLIKTNSANPAFKGVVTSSYVDCDSVNFSDIKLSDSDLYRWNRTVSQITANSYKNLGSIKNFTDEDRNELKTHLGKYYDVEPFLFVSTGGRPAMATYSTPLFDKLSDDFDVVPYAKNNVVILNRNEMLKKIDKNRELFLKRLNLPENLSNKQIYNVFVSEDSPLYNIVDVQDLVGVSFGYPVMDSIVFQLEADSGMRKNIVEERKNLDEYKTKLLVALYSENSRYASFDDAFKFNVEKAIKSITEINPSTQNGCPLGYLYMRFTDNPTEEAEIVENVRKSTQELDKINQKTENVKTNNGRDALGNPDFWINLFKSRNTM